MILIFFFILKPFLRSNIKCGAYEDVEHYLDVQFRLLREDLIIPLRNTIQDYIRANKEETKKDKQQQKIIKVRNIYPK